MKYLFLIALICTSCAKIKHELDGDAKAAVEGLDKIPDDIKVTVEPDFEKAAQFCDDRYLPDLEAAEECFSDYRDFYRVEIGIDFSGIADFCSSRYVDEELIKACEEDLLGLISQVDSPEEEQ